MQRIKCGLGIDKIKEPREMISQGSASAFGLGLRSCHSIYIDSVRQQLPDLFLLCFHRLDA